MNRIDKLIEEMCPEGPPIFPVSKFAKIQGGFSFPSSGMNSDGNGLQVIRIGDVNEKGSNKVFFLGEYPKNSVVEKGNLLLSLSGDIGVKQWEGNTALLNQRVARIDLDLSLVVPRYVYHFLGFAIPKLTSKVRKSAVANLSMNSLRSFKIPLPPLEIQKEIVDILDKFTQLEAELEAELEAREKQYEEVRRRLLDFESDTSNHPLGEMIREMWPEGVTQEKLQDVCQEIIVPMRDRPKALDGDIPWCRIEDIDGYALAGSKKGLGVSSETISSMNLKVFPKGTVVASCSASLGTYAVAERPLVTNQTFIGLFVGPALSNRFLLHVMTTKTPEIRRLASTGTIAYVSREKFENLLVPVPPLEIQEEIVRILDNLDSLVNSVNDGIPAEIAARRKQYEYYRDKLLTFKELDAA